MNELEKNTELDKLLALSHQDLEQIFSQLSLREVESLVNKLNEVSSND